MRIIYRHLIMPQIVKPTPESLAHAVDALCRSGVVAFPTETVYGLGADTCNLRAIDVVYSLKGRPADNPLIAHVADIAAARLLASNWPDIAERLASRFWPGPLTMILPKRSSVPHAATGGRETIAIRMPRHPVARDLIMRFGGPISAPSANRSGRVSPTTAQHVSSDFNDVHDLIILDGGACEQGIESTVIDLTAETPVILRPGTITCDELREILPCVRERIAREQRASPGTSARHYAPRTSTRLVSREVIESASQHRVIALCSPECAAALRSLDSPIELIEMPAEAAAYASALYSALRDADERGANEILIERPASTDGLWSSVLDRLERASYTD